MAQLCSYNEELKQQQGRKEGHLQQSVLLDLKAGECLKKLIASVENVTDFSRRAEHGKVENRQASNSNTSKGSRIPVISPPPKPLGKSLIEDGIIDPRSESCKDNAVATPIR